MIDSSSSRVIAFELEAEDGMLETDIKFIQESALPARCVIFSSLSSAYENPFGLEVVNVPLDKSSPAKLKNFIIDWAEENVKKGFLHIVESTVEILRDPESYILHLEKTMEVFDYRSRFSVVTDPCNYVFNKYNPRVQIEFEGDENAAALGLPDSISFTSHANTAWLTFMVDVEHEKVQRFNESFTEMMYIIIEYLAKRKAQKKDSQLYYMNQYLSISDEAGAIRRNGEDKPVDQKALVEESKVFNSLKLDTAPDNNIDEILERLYNIIVEKQSI